jgi:SPP1 family predicted phage head-tail adaptor
MLGSIYKIGDLDHRIEIYQNVDLEAEGEQIPNFKKIGEVWANVREASGQEKQSAEKETAFGRVVFTIRYDVDFKDEEHRIKWDDDFYDILYIRTVDRKRFLEITGQRLR